MGGETILGILEAAPWTHEDVHTLILQPQTKVDLLRCWLCGHGYRFLSETLVRDKEQLYVVFRVRAGMGQELSEADALTGLLLRSDPLYGEIPVAASYKAQSGERRPRRLVACG